MNDLPYWPYCEECKKPFQFEPDEPFAYCDCGCTEWGNPRPFDWVPNPGDGDLFRYLEKHVAAWLHPTAALPRIVIDPKFIDKNGDVCSLIITGHDGVGSVSLRTAIRIMQGS